jgi:hypothetical protein
MTAEEARRAARYEMGSLDAVKDGWRDAGWESSVEAIGRDLHFGARLLAKNRLVTAIAVGTIALGIGANTAIFSVFDAILLRDLPYPDAGRLAIVWETTGALATGSVSGPDFQDWAREQRVFDSMGAGTEARMTMTGAGEPRRLEGWAVSAEIFPLFGARPETGTLFGPDDVRRERRTIVLGHALWRQTFGGDPRAVGRNLTLDGQDYQVTGVLPEDFHPPAIWTTPQFFVDPFPDPMPPTPTGRALAVDRQEAQSRHLRRARATVSSLQASLAARYPVTNHGRGASVFAPEIRGPERGDDLLLLAAAVGFLLAIACANVASLFAQAARRCEIATARRSEPRRPGRAPALRASFSLFSGRRGPRRRTRSQRLLVPSRRVMHRIGRRAVRPRVRVRRRPCADDRHRVRMRRAGAWRLDVAESLKQGGRTTAGGGARLRRGLVSLEIGAAFVLLLMTGLAVRSLAALLTQDLGFDPHRVLTVGAPLPKRFDSRDRAVGFYDGAVERVRALPGVEAAGVARRLLMGGF